LTYHFISEKYDLLDWYEKEYNVKLNIRFDETNGFNTNYDDVIDAINKN